MSKSPWAGVGTWAAEAEREEAEEREQQAAAAALASSGNRDPQAFPSLKEAASTKSKKKKMSLSEFYSAGSGSGSTRTVRLTPDEMLQLPTGPKQRSDDDFYSGGRGGGGFPNYGRSGAPPGRMRERDADADGSWGSRRSYGGFDDDRRGPPPRRTSDFDSPSRADEVDNWAAGKRPQHAPMMDAGAGGRTNRYGSLGGGSRADEVDSWTSGKRFTQPAPLPSRSNTFVSGSRDADDSDRWRRGDSRETDMVRPRLVLDPPKGENAANETAAVVKTNKPNPFGAARPREEILAEKGLDWKKLDLDIEAKKTTSRPTSSQGSRPSSAHSSRSENVVFGHQGQGMEFPVKSRPKVNPFGDAKPREVLLEEKGKDWRKIDLDLEHRAVDRPETEEEKALKEEIDQLKKQLEKELTINVPQVPGGDQTSLPDVIRLKERELETLVRELDDKVRFGQKAVERPGSGAGRFTGFPERPPSQSGRSEDGRNMEFMDRPRSRGTGNAWPRPADERRAGFQGSRDKGFLGSRDYDRLRSRERW